jgi:hypothetical protein
VKVPPESEDAEAVLFPVVFLFGFQGHRPEDFDGANRTVANFRGESGIRSLEESHLKGNIDVLVEALDVLQGDPPYLLDELIVDLSVNIRNVDFELDVSDLHVLDASLEMDGVGVVDKYIFFREEEERVFHEYVHGLFTPALTVDEFVTDV